MGAETENRDYKYYIDDLSKLLIGSRYTYRELLDEDNLSFRFRSIIRSVMLREVDEDTTLESHLYYMTPDRADYSCYVKLKARVRYYSPEVKRSLSGKEDIKYIEHLVKIQELASLPPKEKQEKGIVIHEIQLSKPALMIYVV